MRKNVLGGLLALVAAFCQAQEVQTIGVTKRLYQNQTSDSAVNLIGAGFTAFIEGDSLNAGYPFSPVTVTPPGKSAENFGFEGDGWFVDKTFSSKAALEAAYPNGTYQLKMSGETIPLNLSGDGYPNAPKATVSAGKWVRGKLQVTASAAAAGFSIQSNASTGNGFESIEILGTASDYNRYESLETGGQSIQVHLEPGELAPGLYEVYVEFDNVVDFQSAGAIDDEAEAFALYSSETDFFLEVVQDSVLPVRISVTATRKENGATSAVISWTSDNQQNWLLQGSEDLAEWTTIGNTIISHPGLNSIDVPESAATARFFRLKTP
jgi:hypothetical protein